MSIVSPNLHSPIKKPPACNELTSILTVSLAASLEASLPGVASSAVTAFEASLLRGGMLRVDLSVVELLFCCFRGGPVSRVGRAFSHTSHHLNIIHHVKLFVFHFQFLAIELYI